MKGTRAETRRLRPLALLLPGGSPFDVFSLPDTITPVLI